MSTYFKDFPTIKYDLNKDGSTIEVINILKRFKPLDALFDRTKLYYDYYVNDGERPDIVAHKVYGDETLHWVIMMFNRSFDPYFEWHKGHQDFCDFIDAKYGNIEYATQNVHHYEWIVQPYQKLNNGNIIQEKFLVVDRTTFLTLTEEERRSISFWDYEDKINKTKQFIKILDNSYIPQVLEEKAKIFNA